MPPSPSERRISKRPMVRPGPVAFAPVGGRRFAVGAAVAAPGTVADSAVSPGLPALAPPPRRTSKRSARISEIPRMAPASPRFAPCCSTITARPATPAPVTAAVISGAPSAGASDDSAIVPLPVVSATWPSDDAAAFAGPEVDRLRHGEDAGQLVGTIVRRHRRHLDQLDAFAARDHDGAVLRRRHRRRRLGNARQRHQLAALEALQDLDALAGAGRERQLARAQIAHRRHVGRQRAEDRAHLRQRADALVGDGVGLLDRAADRGEHRGHTVGRRHSAPRRHERRRADAGERDDDAGYFTCRHAPLRTCPSTAAARAP